MSTTADQPDLVNHPPHYTSHPSGVECIDVVEHMTFNLGNAIKYIWRADEKGNALEDLRKAAWYVQREIEKRQRDAGLCTDCGQPMLPEHSHWFPVEQSVD
jgi:hypothetical protein